MSLDVYLEGPEGSYSRNITHNLGPMANAAGVYGVLWRPEENNIKTAADLIKPLSVGLDDLLERPDHFAQFNADNGWGLYEHFVPWVRDLLAACKENPTATVTVSR